MSLFPTDCGLAADTMRINLYFKQRIQADFFILARVNVKIPFVVVHLYNASIYL